MLEAKTSVRSGRLTFVSRLSSIVLLLAACATADPALVSQSVNATLTAIPTQTPVVVVVTVLKGGGAIPTVTAPPATDAPPLPLTATPDPDATPAPSVTDLPVSLTPPGPLLFTDDFSQPSVWNLGEDAMQRVTLADGKLLFTLKEPDLFRFIYNLTRRGRDFYASLTGSAQACAFRDRYGLLFRVQDNANYYQFEADCDGRYRLSKIAEGALTALKDWTPVSALNPQGGPNELGVRAQGQTLELFGNGQALLKTSDDSYAEGGFGLYVGAGLSPEFTASFDDFSVWEIR
jgi:hypothetical protein